MSGIMMNLLGSTFDSGGAGNFIIAMTDNSAHLRGTFAYGIAIDSEGNYFVLGKVYTSTRYGYIVKIDPEGTILSSARIDASGISYEPYSICIDSSDNIYIGGRANGNLPYIIKYNSSLSLQWAYEYSGNGTVSHYNGSYSAVKTDGTDVFMAYSASLSGVGTRGVMLRVACSNGNVVAARRLYKSGGTQQYFLSDIELSGSYIYIGGFDITNAESFVLGLNKSDNTSKSDTNIVAMDNPNRSSDDRQVNLNKDANGIVYAASHYVDSDNFRRHAGVAKFEGDAAFEQGDYHIYGTQQFGNSTLGSVAIPTNNADNDVIIWSGFGHTDSNRLPTFMSVDNALDGTTNWMNYYKFSGTYHDGNANSFNMEVEPSSTSGIKCVMSKDGKAVVGIGTLMNFDQDSSNTNVYHMAVFSQTIDGNHDAPQNDSLTITTNGQINTRTDDLTNTSLSFSNDDNTSSTSKTDKSGSFSINTSYTLAVDSLTF
jgi:hypothetical protein